MEIFYYLNYSSFYWIHLIRDEKVTNFSQAAMDTGHIHSDELLIHVSIKILNLHKAEFPNI